MRLRVEYDGPDGRVVEERLLSLRLGVLYEIGLRTTTEHYGSDEQNFSKVVAGFIRTWKLHLRSDTSLADLSRMFNPIIRGWIRYYGRFYRSGLYPLRRYLNGVFARWATRKYKKLRRHFRRAEQWLLRISRRDPQLFAHWELGAQRGSTAGAV